MSTPRFLLLIPIAALTLVACGSDDDKAADTAAPTTTAAAAATTTVAGGTETSEGPTTTGAPQEGPVQIDVVVGTDSGPDRVVTVKTGSDITLNITNPDAADEFHVHGVDLEQSVDAGVMATFNFTVDTAGTYEVESHTTEEVLLVIQVVD